MERTSQARDTGSSREARRSGDTTPDDELSPYGMQALMMAGGNQAMVALSQGGGGGAAGAGARAPGSPQAKGGLLSRLRGKAKSGAKAKPGDPGAEKSGAQVPRYDATAFDKAPQLKKIRASVIQALKITKAALARVKLGDSAYKTWMDKAATSKASDAAVLKRVAHVRTGLEKVQRCLEGDTVVFKRWDLPEDDDTREADTYAYVYTAEKENNIYLGGAFWVARTKGTDSSAGTIVHELTHRLHGTADHVYGQDGAKDLAKNAPAKATSNADNYEYLAEKA